MKSSSHSGKYQSKRPRRSPVPVLVILLGLAAALFCVVLFLSISSQQQFRELSERVQTAASAPVTFPAETSGTSAAETNGDLETTAPTETQPQVLQKYQELYTENPDLFGWLTIADTTIDYPVMHTPDDPEKYLHANFAGQYNFAGTPFVDGACDPDSDNLIIYAHNMLDGSMFRGLLKYQQKDYWQRHPSITFDTLYEEQEYEVLAAFFDRVYYKTEDCFKFYQFIDAEDEADFENAMANYREKALYDTGVEATYGDQLITLVTCSSHVENGRFVVVARKK